MITAWVIQLGYIADHGTDYVCSLSAPKVVEGGVGKGGGDFSQDNHTQHERTPHPQISRNPA